MKHLISIISIPSWLSNLYAQGLDTLSTINYNGLNIDTGCSVREISDSGFIVAAETTSIGGVGIDRMHRYIPSSDKRGFCEKDVAVEVKNAKTDTC